MAANSGRPLRRAQVSISAPGIGRLRTTSTDADGRYEFTDLPAGRFTMMVERNGFLPLRYGQRRPLEQGKPLDVSDRQVVEGIDFAMPKMSVIAGRITDEFGDPIAGVMVYALHSIYIGGRRRLVPTGQTQGRTDETGEYRLIGLVPGTYIVTAKATEKWSVDEGRRNETMGYSPTFFPGTTNVGDARKIPVGLGIEASDIDFALIPGRAARLSGTAFDSKGRPFNHVHVAQEVRGQNYAMFSTAGGASVGADGRFTITNITPGEYTLE